MEVEYTVSCNECGEKFKVRFDTSGLDKEMQMMAVCPSCQKEVEVTLKGNIQRIKKG